MTAMRCGAAVLLPILLITGGCPSERSSGTATLAEHRFAFWNVENLFDTDDDPDNPGDDEFLPELGWTDARYRLKRARLASVIAAVEPGLLGFAEVENRAVLEHLFDEPALRDAGYRIAHIDTADARGIDLALAYRAPFTLAGEQPVRLHAVPPLGRRSTRGILEVRLAVDDARLAVLVCHWPSRGGDRDGRFRERAAAVTRQVAEAWLADSGADADLLILGDLNDDPFDRSVRTTLGAIRSANAVRHRRGSTQFFNPSWSLLAEPDLGTTYYNAEWQWNVFDQAIVSRGMLDARGFRYVEGSLTVHAPVELRDQHRRPRRFRRSRDGEWSIGYSDHFMIHGSLTRAASR